MVRKIVGTVVGVMREQGLAETHIDDYERNRGYEVNKTTIGVDLPRTALIDFTGTFDAFRAEFEKEEVYQRHYAQGNTDGGGVEDIYTIYKFNKQSDLYSQIERLNETLAERRGAGQDCSDLEARLQQINTELNEFQAVWFGGNNKNSLRVAYRDDNGNLCGLGYYSNKEKPDLWSLKIDRYTPAGIETRQTTLFTHEELCREGAGEAVDMAALPHEMEIALNSRMLSALTYGLLDAEGRISEERLSELKRRAFSNINLDDRDTRRIQLQEFADNTRGILPATYLADINTRSLNDPNFFEGVRFTSMLQEAFETAQSLIGENQEMNADEKAMAIYKAQLTLFAIKLELQAFYLVGESNNFKRQAMLAEAQRLREERDAPLPAVAELDYATRENNALGPIAAQLEHEAKVAEYHQKFGELERSAGDIVYLTNDVEQIRQNAQAPDFFVNDFSDALERIRVLNAYALKYKKYTRDLATLAAHVNGTGYLETIVENIRQSLNDQAVVRANNFANVSGSIAKVDGYVTALEAFEEELNKHSNATAADKQKLYTQGYEVLQQIKDVIKNDPQESNLAQMSKVLKACTNALKISGHDENQFKRHIGELATLSQEISGHGSPRLKKLGIGLLVFAGLALVAVGILAAIPTGGTSLLLVVAGAVGMQAAIAATAATITVAGVAGAGFFRKSRETGLAKLVTGFREAVSNAGGNDDPVQPGDAASSPVVGTPRRESGSDSAIGSDGNSDLSEGVGSVRTGSEADDSGHSDGPPSPLSPSS